MRYHRIIPFIAAAMLVSHAANARADDIDDCSSGEPERMISGCTHLIETGQIDGVPISNRNLAFAYNNRGLAHFDNRDYSRALMDHTEAIRIDPSYHVAYSNRGNAYARAGEYELAIDDHNQAVHLAPSDPNTYFNRGFSHFLYEAFADAVEDFRRAVELRPEDPGMRQSYADTLYFTGDVLGATREWNAACANATAHLTRIWKMRLNELGHFDGPIDGACGQDVVTAFEACARSGCYF